MFALCLRLAVRVASPTSQRPIQCPIAYFPSPSHPHTLSPSTLLKVCLIVSLRFSFSAAVVHVAQNDVADLSRPADIFRSRIPIWCPQVVSNRSSSHFYSYNRVDDVSKDVLTHIRRVRRCQNRQPRSPRYGCPHPSHIPLNVLMRSLSCSTEDRKGREACQRQEEHWRA